MNEDIILSICIPTYNGGEYLIKSVNSILSCASNQFEIVINDNATQSRDTINVLKEIKDKRLKIFVNEIHLGHIKNWYVALGHGRGKYLMLLQDNDVLVVENLEKYIALLGTLDVICVRNGVRRDWLLPARDLVRTDVFFFYSLWYTHGSYLVYRRDTFINTHVSEMCFDSETNGYLSTWLDMEFLAEHGPDEKSCYLNLDIKIVEVPERKIASRTREDVIKKNGNKYINYTYENVMYYSGIQERYLAFKIQDQSILTKYIFYHLLAEIKLATFRYYEHIVDKRARERYGVPLVNWTQKEWLDLGGKYLNERLKTVKVICRFPLEYVQVLYLAVELYRITFEAYYFLNRSIFNPKYVWNVLKRIYLKQRFRRLWSKNLF